MTRVRPSALALLTLALAAPAVAQTWPEKGIRIVVGFPPGPTDLMGRPVAAKLQEVLKVPVVFENKIGRAHV